MLSYARLYSIQLALTNDAQQAPTRTLAIFSSLPLAQSFAIRPLIDKYAGKQVFEQLVSD